MLRPDLIVLLVVIPMAAGILTTMLRGWLAVQRLVGLLSLVSIIFLAIGYLLHIHPGGIETTQAGAWPAPFGISIVLDEFSALLIIAANVVGLCCYLHAFTSLDDDIEKDWFHPLFHLMMMGVNYCFITGDLFNLFVAFEITLMASYGLICLGATRQQLTQAYKYVILNLIGSTFFVLGAGLVYGLMGTLNFADLARLTHEAALNGEATPAGFEAVAIMLFFVFALKAALFPLWFWLPDTYHTCPIAIGALFGGLLTKIGIYAMLRIFPMVFVAPELREASPILVIIAVGAGLTMILAIIAAIAMQNIRRILALTLVSHIGYLGFGAAMMTPDGLAGAVYYMLQHMLVMAALFLCCGLIERVGGSDDLARVSGLHRRAPYLSVLFLVAAMSLVGLPPLSGFYGKLLLIREGFALVDKGYWVLSVTSLLTGILTMIAMIKIWALAFWSPPAREAASASRSKEESSLAPAYVGATVLVLASISMALGAEVVIGMTRSATMYAEDPSVYVKAVMGEDAWRESGVVATHETQAPTLDIDAIAGFDERAHGHDEEVQP